jgi:hypothetical protein
MTRKLRGKLTYANVMATVAAFLAFGGGAYAAFHLPKNSVRSTNIVNGQVRLKDLAPSARPSTTTTTTPGTTTTTSSPTLWAVVHHVGSSGVLVRSQGALGIQRTAAGNYDIQFNRAVNNCSASATQIDYGAVETVQAYTNQDHADPGLDDSEVHVQLVDNGATAQDISFNLQVFC